MNAPGDGGAGCMNPTGVAGQMIFNSATNYMQYCEGSDWMKVGLRGIPTDGLIGYWPFDDGTGSTTAEDVIGTTDGTLNNMDANTDWVDGIMGGGLDLDGNDDYISLGDYAGIEGVSALTISIWVKNHKTQILATGNERIIDKNGAGNDTLQLTWQQSEDMHFSIQTNAGAGNDLVAVYTDGPPPGSANQWHHIVGVYDGLEIKLYVNGVLGSVTQPHTQLTNNTAHALLIGTDEGAGEGWDGVVDELRIYNRALSPAEVYDLYLGTGGN